MPLNFHYGKRICVIKLCKYGADTILKCKSMIFLCENNEIGVNVPFFAVNYSSPFCVVKCQQCI